MCFNMKLILKELLYVWGQDNWIIVHVNILKLWNRNLKLITVVEEPNFIGLKEEEIFLLL